MTEATCAVLTAIFPLFMVTMILERRTTNMGIRRRKLYQGLSYVATTCALLATPYAVIGVAIGGFSFGGAFVLWALFVVAWAGVAIVVVGSIASAEVEEERSLPSDRRARARVAGRQHEARTRATRGSA